MSTNHDELIAAQDALLDAISHLENDTADLRGEFADVLRQLAEDRDHVQGAAALFTQQVEELQGVLGEFDSGLATIASTLAQGAEHAAERITDSSQKCSAALNDAVAAYDAGLEHCEQQCGTLSATTASHANAFDEYAHSVLSMQGTTSQMAEESCRQLDAFTHVVGETQHGSDSFVRELAARLSSEQEHVARLHDELLSTLGSAVEVLSQQMHNMAQEGVCRPAEALCEQTKHAFQADANAALRDVFSVFDHALSDIEAKLTEAMHRTRSKREGLAPVRESLDAVQAPISAVLDQVRATANLVGFHP